MDALSNAQLLASRLQEFGNQKGEVPAQIAISFTQVYATIAIAEQLARIDKELNLIRNVLEEREG